MSLLEQLPVELLHRICQQFHDQRNDHKHIAALRLVSRGVQAVADEYLVPRLSIHYLREEFENVERILAGNPRIAKGVRSVRYHADRLLQLPRIEHWKDMRRRIIHMRQAELASAEALAQSGSACPQRLPERARRRHMRNFNNAMARELTKYNKKEQEAMYAEYDRLFKDQTNMMDEARTTICFERILAMCPKISSVAVVMLAHTGAHAEHSRLRGRLYEDRYGVGPYGDSASTRIGTRPAMEVLEAIHKTGTAGRLSLHLEPLSFQFFAQHNENIMEEMYQAVSGLKGLHIGINDRCLNQDRVEYGPDFDEEPDAAVEALILAEEAAELETPGQSFTRVLGAFDDKRLTKFLARATNLTSLSIKAPRPSESARSLLASPSCLNLSSITEPFMTWPHLTSLNLENIKCDDHELSDLITRHQGTLEELSLRGVEFGVGSLRTCLEVFAGKMPELRNVTLRGDFFRRPADIHQWESIVKDMVLLSRKAASRVPDQYTRALQRYVLNGGEKFPEQRDEGARIDYTHEETVVPEESSDEEEDYDSDEYDLLSDRSDDSDFGSSEDEW